MGLSAHYFWITYSVENLSQMNRLAAPALGESFAVEIRASAVSGPHLHTLSMR